MRVLLVIDTDKLAENLAPLNPDLEYCGMVVNDVKAAEEVLERIGLSQVPLYPMSELKACVEGLSYDYVFCLQKNFYSLKCIKEIANYNVSKDKLLPFGGLFSEVNFKTEQLLRYYREHSQDFEMFVTGISYTERAIDVTKFKRKLFKLAKPSQDLYYDFQVAKSVILCGGGIVSYVMR